MSHILKLSIIVPAYNEANTIHLILDKIKSVELLNNIQKEIIIVNDCSTDTTEDSIKQYICLLYTSPSPRDVEESRMPSSA